MAFTERLQNIDRRVAYGAALIIALVGVATGCEKPDFDPEDTTTWRVTHAAEQDAMPAGAEPAMLPHVLPEAFDLHALGLVEVPQQ